MDDIKLNKEEELYYTKVFNLGVDSDIINDLNATIKIVSAAKAKDIFLLSKVETKILSNVWKICSKNKKYLELENFK